MTQDDGDEAEGLGLGEPGASPIGRGAAIDGDADALAAAADTSIDMDGFETGAGFDLDDLPDEPSVDLGVQALEVRSSTFDEVDLAEAETASSAEVVGANPVVDEVPDRAIVVDWAVDPPPITGQADVQAPETAHAGPPEVPTDTSGDPVPETRLLGLEELNRRRKRRARARHLLAAASTVLILGGGGFAMVYLGVVEVRGITRLDRSGFPVRPPIALPGPQPTTPVMSHVLFVDAWREAEMPLAWAAALRERMPDLLGFVTPLSIDRERQYGLVVGPAYSEVEANDLKGPLETALVLLNPDPQSWTVRWAPYSFFFGEYDGSGPANARVQELADLSIPVFVLQVTYSAGATRLRVYGGAFSDEFQAGEMGGLLSEHNLEDIPLTERRGRLPE